MYIAPVTKLYILHNVPLDTSYDHTLYFATPEAQYTYFNSLAKYRAGNFTYVRYNDGVVRVGYKADDLYDCNYIMFQNFNFGSKWFYAYIKSINYVSNEVSEITFEMDVIQTWLFDFEPDFCFVERTHPATDVIGEHIEPEGIEIGEYIFNTYEPIDALYRMSVIVAVVDTNEGSSGYLNNGIYSGAQLWAFASIDRDGIADKINEYIQSPDSIVAIYMCPNILINADNEFPPQGGKQLTSSTEGIQKEYTFSGVGNATFIDGYLPKNKKLLTYPYCFFHVDNGNGSELSLRYEFFRGGIPRLNIGGTIVQPVQIILNPKDYKLLNGVTSDTPNKTLNISLNSYPMCSWNVDAYKAWLAQNSVPMALNAGSQMAMAIGNAFTARNPIMGLAGVVSSGLSLATNAFNDVYKASIAADICKGTSNSGNANVSIYQQNFYAGMVSITAEYARSIDDYFSKFGYSIKRLMKPVLNARPHWTYIKTIGCTLTGSVPCDDMKAICDLFDRGITFWMNGNEVGNYSLDNRPIGG